MTVLELVKMIDTSVRYNGGKVFDQEFSINFYEDGKMIGFSIEKNHLCGLEGRTVARWHMDMPNINVYLCL